MENLTEYQVKLSDGRIVELREQKGSDEMVVAAQLGDNFTPDGAGAIIFQNCLIAQTVTKVGDQPRPPLRGFAAYRDFLAQFKGKDWNRIKKKYDELNGDLEEENKEGNGSEAE